MRALTLRPQWAHAVAHLAKTVENRPRPIPRALVGERIAIHAGATLPPGWLADLVAACPTAIMGGGGGSVPGWTCPIAPWDVAREQGREIATRSIVAVVTLRGHLDVSGWQRARAELAASGGLDPGIPEWADPAARWWWELTDVVALRTPVPVPRGQLGLWKLDPETEADVRRGEAACRRLL